MTKSEALHFYFFYTCFFSPAKPGRIINTNKTYITARIICKTQKFFKHTHHKSDEIYQLLRGKMKVLETINKKIYLNQLKDIIVGYITSYTFSQNLNVTGLALIKNKYLEEQKSFYLEDFGEINIKKSIGSIFL